jgi:hypothetical protein
MSEKPRFFSREQKEEHGRDIGGYGCEFNIEKFERCEGGHIEADHLLPHSKGGETDADNLLLSCKPHHFWKHFIDEEPWAANLILNRMGDDEKDILRSWGLDV